MYKVKKKTLKDKVCQKHWLLVNPQMALSHMKKHLNIYASHNWNVNRSFVFQFYNAFIT